jgi:dipeptidyl aminopeptidase/acylaminoacyl peptidase
MRDRAMSLIDTFAAISVAEEYSLSPDGSSIAFKRDVNGYSQIFVMPVGKTGWLRQITATLSDCSEPQWSPDGRQLVFVRDDALWMAQSDGAQARELTDHPAGNSEPRWSPDGERIAFLSRRRGWEHVWTISPDGGALTEVTRGAFDAVDPVWSQDSQSLAFCSVREDDLMTRGVYLIPVQNGAETLISPRGCWSGAPHFSPDGRTLAYLSDHDGWFHIYVYDLNSHETRQLTCGEVEDGGPYFYNVDPHGGPIYSPDGKQVAFIRHRQGCFDVWVADVLTADAHRISVNDGHHRIVGWVDGTRLAVTFDSAARPPDLWVLSLDQSAVPLTDSCAGALHGTPEISPEWLTYPARDGLTIHAALFRPPVESGGTKQTAAKGMRAPAVLFLHGGPNFEFGDFYYPLPQILANEGYVVLAPNVRGSTGYGTAFRHANFREWGHADAYDAIEGVRWLQAQSFVDPTRIAVVGPSYGGYLALSVLTLAPEMFCAGVDMYGDSEIAESFRHGDRYGRLDLKRQMGTPEENPEGYRRGSPVYLAERIESPLLILHGEDDMLVVPLMSDKIIEALKIEDKYFESKYYENEGHGFEKPENKKDAWERICKFLNRYCKDEK